MLLREGPWPPGAVTASPPPQERAQHAGEVAATATADTPTLFGQAENRRSHDQPEAGERPAEIRPGSADSAVRDGVRVTSETLGLASGVAAGEHLTVGGEGPARCAVRGRGTVWGRDGVRRRRAVTDRGAPSRTDAWWDRRGARHGRRTRHGLEARTCRSAVRGRAPGGGARQRRRTGSE